MKNIKIDGIDFGIDFKLPSNLENPCYKYLYDWMELKKLNEINKNEDNDSYTILEILPEYEFKNLHIIQDISDDIMSLSFEYEHVEKI